MSEKVKKFFDLTDIKRPKIVLKDSSGEKEFRALKPRAPGITGYWEWMEMPIGKPVTDHMSMKLDNMVREERIKFRK